MTNARTGLAIFSILALAACDTANTSQPGGGSSGTADAAGSSTSSSGGSSSSGGVTDGGNGATDAGMNAPDAHVPEPDAGPPVNCSALSGASVQLCSSTADTCGVVFSASQGCAATCASAGLGCVEGYEDVTGSCEPDTSRSPVGCAPTGHVSDYCVCGRSGATPPDAGMVDPDAGAPGADPCSATALYAERVGYGRNTTGGNPSRIFRVTTLSGGTSGSGNSGSLRYALESDEPWWIVFNVDGRITYDTPINVKSNKTVDGRGRDVELRGTLRVASARNVIITDVRMMNDLTAQCGQEGDVLILTGPGGSATSDFPTRDVWVHHVELHNGGDGLMDVRGGTNITVSWTHFHTHSKGLLMWADSNDDPVPGMRVTMHHNFFDRLTIRGPQFLFGRLHYFNNFQFEWFDYGAGCLGGAQCLSQRNVFQSRNACNYCEDTNPCGDMAWFPDFTEAFVNDWATNGAGSIRSEEDLALNGAVVAVRQPETVFDPAADYAFTAEPASQALADRIRAGAGPRTTLQCNR